MGLATGEQVERLMEALDAQKTARADDMPDDAAALAVLQRAYTRLKELGWRNAVYCPKDGTPFEVIEAGSTGIHDCVYRGDWPKGSWWVMAAGDLWPSRPILFRPKPPSLAAQIAESMRNGTATFVTPPAPTGRDGDREDG